MPTLTPEPAVPTHPASGEVSRWLRVVLHHAGGAGGSFIAALLTEYLAESHRARGIPVLGLDLARNNAIFSHYDALGVRRVRLDDDLGTWSFTHSMDAAVEAVAAELPLDAVAVVDLSTTGFRAFFAYAAEGVLAPVLAEAGVGLVLHAVARAGRDLLADAVAAYTGWAGLPADTPAVCWINAGWNHGCRTYADALATEAAEVAVTAEALATALAQQYRVVGAVRIPAITPERCGRGAMYLRRSSVALLTLAEVLHADDLDCMTRHRLAAVRDDVFGQLARATQTIHHR